MINPPTLGKDKWPSTPEEIFGDEVTKFYELRNQAYYNLIGVEFQLAYHAHISIRDIDAMDVHERRTFMELLKQQKKSEEEQMAQAQSKIKK